MTDISVYLKGEFDYPIMQEQVKVHLMTMTADELKQLFKSIYHAARHKQAVEHMEDSIESFKMQRSSRSHGGEKAIRRMNDVLATNQMNWSLALLEVNKSFNEKHEDRPQPDKTGRMLQLKEDFIEFVKL